MDDHSGEAKKFSEVLQHELEQIAKRRNPTAAASDDKPLAEEKVREKALEAGLVGLSFSGGGIRSATFNLGILQALADFGLLKYVDYLSTVSGGGYIGSWLAAWIKRDGKLENVETQLKTTRADQAQATRNELHVLPGDIAEIPIAEIPVRKCEVREAEPEPIAHLRSHSNYLSPRLGIFSADIWVLGAIYLRNLLLNQAAMLPAFLVIMLAVRLIFWEFLCGNQSVLEQHAEWELGIALGLSLVAIGWIIYSLWRLWEMDGDNEAKPKMRLQMGSGMLHLFVLLPLLIAAILACRVFVSKGVGFWDSLINAPTSHDDLIKWVNAWIAYLLPRFIVIVAGIYPAIAVGLQLGAGIRFVWSGNSWHWGTAFLSMAKFMSWLLVGCLFGLGGLLGCVAVLVAGIVAILILLLPLVAMYSLFDLSRKWGVHIDQVFDVFAVGLLLGTAIAVLHVLANLLVVLATAHRLPVVLLGGSPFRQVCQALCNPICQVCKKWDSGRLLRWYLLGMLSGVGAVLLFYVVRGLQLWIHSWLVKFPEWSQALDWGWTVGLLHGSVHLYYLCFLFLRFCRKKFEKEGGWKPFLGKYLGTVGFLVLWAIVGLLYGSLCLQTFGEAFARVTKFYPAAVAAICVTGLPTVMIGAALWLKFPAFRPMPWWLLGGILGGVLGGVLLSLLGETIAPSVDYRISPPALIAVSEIGLMASPDGSAFLAMSASARPVSLDPFAIALLVVFGPPAILGIIMLMIALEIGLVSRFLPESMREWLGSLCGWLMIYAAWYLLVVGVVLFGGWLLIEAGPWLQGLLGVGWLSAAIGGVLAGHSPWTGNTKGSRRLDLIATIAPYIFLIGLLFLVSLLVTTLVDNPPTEAVVKARIGVAAKPDEPSVKVTRVKKDNAVEEKTQTREHFEDYDKVKICREQFWQGIAAAKPGTLGAAFFGFGILAFIMACRVDVNIFSLSALYGNRLVRCYLGASRAKAQSPDNPVLGAPIDNKRTDSMRQPNPITGIDALDDFPLRSLVLPARDGPVKNLAAKLDTAGLLKIDESFHYVVTAVTALGETAHSNQVTVRSCLGKCKVILTWESHPKAIAYKVYRSNISGVYVSPALLLPLVGRDCLTYTDAGAEVVSFDDQNYVGPYLLINAALNQVHADNLAWQERKAESFVFTPLYCGSMSTGFQPLQHHDLASHAGHHLQERRDKLTLGKAVTISGAAASPNMGYHSSPAVTALMTVFNARLGCWVSNPAVVGLGAWLRKNIWPRWQSLQSLRTRVWVPRGPFTGLLYLAAEMFGFTGSRSSYVYLSDGGHFENLGVYELVRRRCRFIIASDAGADPGYEFEDLAGMIRKCRTDFGIRIDIDVARLRPEGPNKHCPWHCAIGLIRYDDVDSTAAPGILVYLKASLSGDEPSDVQNYASAHATFPHESTLDQFFTESQFESYRTLGHHIAQKVFSDAIRQQHGRGKSATKRGSYVKNLFAAVRRRWFPPPPEQEKEFLESVKAFVDTQDALRTDTALRPLSKKLYPEFEPTTEKPKAWPSFDSGTFPSLHMVAQMLQVMENAWLGVHLEGFYAHPMNRGWMSVFRRWSSSKAFQDYWPFLRGEFGQDFVRFCELQLGLKTTRAQTVPIDPMACQPILCELLEKIAQEWKDIPRFQEWAKRQAGPKRLSPAMVKALTPRRFLSKDEAVDALRKAVKALADNNAHAKKILDKHVNNSIASLEKMPAQFSRTELARALEVPRERLKNSWEDSIRTLVRWKVCLENAKDDELVNVEKIRFELDDSTNKDGFTNEFGRQWPKHVLRQDYFKTLASDSWYVMAADARSTVNKVWLELDRAWNEELRFWNEMIESISKDADQDNAITDLDAIKVQLVQRLEHLKESWTGEGPTFVDLIKELNPLLKGTNLPLSAECVRLELLHLHSRLSQELPATVRDTWPARLTKGVNEILKLDKLKPMVWLIPLPKQAPAPNEWSDEEYACGLICVLPQSSGCSEILVWVRGPYRNLGIGRECFEKKDDHADTPIEQIWKAMVSVTNRDCLGNERKKDDLTLVVRYPNGALPGSGEKLERAMWLSFFFDYDFRRQKREPDKKSTDPDLVLECRYADWLMRLNAE